MILLLKTDTSDIIKYLIFPLYTILYCWYDATKLFTVNILRNFTKKTSKQKFWKVKSADDFKKSANITEDVFFRSRKTHIENFSNK